MKKQKECPMKYVKDKEGKIRNPYQILEKSKEYFKKLLAGKNLTGGEGML